jgi:hypothetical protein
VDGNDERVNWEDAASAGNDPSRNGDIYHGEVAWHSTVKEVKGARFAWREIIRIGVSGWSWVAGRPPGVLSSIISVLWAYLFMLLMVGCFCGLVLLWIIAIGCLCMGHGYWWIRAIALCLIIPSVLLCFAPFVLLSQYAGKVTDRRHGNSA